MHLSEKCSLFLRVLITFKQSEYQFSEYFLISFKHFYLCKYASNCKSRENNINFNVDVNVVNLIYLSVKTCSMNGRIFIWELIAPMKLLLHGEKKD